MLVASGVFRVVHKVYGGIGPAFYGLRTTMLILLFMALWRIQRPEALKGDDPQSDILTETAPVIPGTRLTMRFAVPGVPLDDGPGRLL